MSPFIVFEGIDGAGKTTQARGLLARLKRRGYPAVLLQEPGSTALGRQIRRLLLTHRGRMSARAELLLFAASRAQMVEELAQPLLSQGIVVIADRYTASTWAYQGAGRGLDSKLLRLAEETATDGLQPDLILLLDVPAAIGLARKAKGSPRFEGGGVAFEEPIRQCYRELAEADTGRWRILDGTLPLRTVGQQVWRAVAGLLAAAATGAP